VARHLQNPHLYSAQGWADAVETYELIGDDGGGKGAPFSSTSFGLWTKKSVAEGDVLTLFPCDDMHLVSTKAKSTGNAEYEYEVPLLNRRVYRYRGVIPPGIESVFVGVRSPSRRCVPGWMGHLARTTPAAALDKNSKESANCALVPLAGAAPICALVATQDLAPNTPLIRQRLRVEDDDTPSVDDVEEKQQEQQKQRHKGMIEQLAERTSERYCSEVAELRSFLNMAYEAQLEQQKQRDRSVPEKDENINKCVKNKPSDSSYHPINLQYPGLRRAHEEPDVYVVPNFLTPDECRKLIRKAGPHLQPSLVVQDTDTGAVDLNPNRTSTDANIPQREVPTIVDKIVRLTTPLTTTISADEDDDGVDRRRYLEILQVLRYVDSQQFKPHTDGFDGPVQSACGFEDSGRLVTVFVYLNDVEKGGATRFTRLGLDVQPRQGTAVLHFPNYRDSMREDVRTEHASVPAVDEKWLLVTWLWRDPRSDPRYSECHLKRLSDEII